MGSCYSCKGDGGRTYAYTTVDMAATTGIPKDKIPQATATTRNFGFALPPSKKRTPELVSKHEHYIAATINRNSSSLPTFPSTPRRPSSSSSSNNSLGLPNKPNPQRTSSAISRFGFGFKGPTNIPMSAGSLESVASATSVNNSSDDNCNEVTRKTANFIAKKGLTTGGGSGPASRTGSPILKNNRHRARNDSPELRNSLNKSKLTFDVKNRAVGVGTGMKEKATVVTTQVSGLPKPQQVLLCPSKKTEKQESPEPMELDEADSGLGNSDRTVREGDGDSETLADIEQILEDVKLMPNKHNAVGRLKKGPVVFPKPKPVEPTRPGCIRPVRASGIPAKVPVAKATANNIFAIGRDTVLSKGFAATHKQMVTKVAKPQRAVVMDLEEDEKSGENDVTITDESQVLNERDVAEILSSKSPSPAKSCGQRMDDSQEGSLKNSEPFSPPSERECFLIDDEIADQPDLIACNNIDFDGRFTSTILDWSGSISGADEAKPITNFGGGNLTGKVKERSSRRRSCSGGTLSPCSSLDSDDLVLDFENVDERTAKMTGDRFCWKDDVSRESRRASDKELEPNERIGAQKDLRTANSMPGLDTSDGGDAEQLEQLDAMCLELAEIKLSLGKLEKVLHEDVLADTMNPFELTAGKFQNGLFLNMANSDFPDGCTIKKKMSLETAEKISLAESEQEKADLKRQIVLLQQQLAEKDKSIKRLQQQLKMCSFPRETEKEVSNAASQTDRVRPLVSSSRSPSTDESISGATVSARQETLC